jgi:hypothetical protein
MTFFFNIHLSRIVNLLRRQAAGKVLRSLSSLVVAQSRFSASITAAGYTFLFFLDCLLTD